MTDSISKSWAGCVTRVTRAPEEPHPWSDNELMCIRAARGTELPTLQAIERAAGLMFGDIGMPEIAQYTRCR